METAGGLPLLFHILKLRAWAGHLGALSLSLSLLPSLPPYPHPSLSLQAPPLPSPVLPLSPGLNIPVSPSLLAVSLALSVPVPVPVSLSLSLSLSVYISFLVSLSFPSPSPRSSLAQGTDAAQVFEMEYLLPMFHRFGTATQVSYLLCLYKVGTCVGTLAPTHAHHMRVTMHQQEHTHFACCLNSAHMHSKTHRSHFMLSRSWAACISILISISISVWIARYIDRKTILCCSIISYAAYYSGLPPMH